MGGNISDLHTDLIYLRKGVGFTSTRIRAAGTLVHLLGGPREPFENLRERFISAVNSLRDPEADLLMDAFGLSPATQNLTTLRQRREHHGRQISRRIDTVSDREDAALVNLRNQLLTGWYPASPLTIRVPELHNGIVQEHVAVVTVVNDRRWQETREHYRFFAAFDEADYLTISASYPGRPIPLPEGKSPFTVRTRHVGNSYSHDFIHHTPMRRGNSYDLAFKLVPEPDDNDPDLLTETSRAFHERTLTAALEAIFIGERPRRIWSYERLSYFERPGQPKPSSLLDVTHTSSARASYRDLYGGLFNGIAWEW
ncbi:MAG TPA: hypothetical protein PKC31_00860 [Candidatus Nanoperiomorbaceae bacterium]|nr:hypothetical protein [Candidatus Nanoperiomorbaceae bacterium]